MVPVVGARIVIDGLDVAVTGLATLGRHARTGERHLGAMAKAVDALERALQGLVTTRAKLPDAIIPSMPASGLGGGPGRPRGSSLSPDEKVRIKAQQELERVLRQVSSREERLLAIRSRLQGQVAGLDKSSERYRLTMGRLDKTLEKLKEHRESGGLLAKINIGNDSLKTIRDTLGTLPGPLGLAGSGLTLLGSSAAALTHPAVLAAAAITGIVFATIGLANKSGEFTAAMRQLENIVGIAGDRSEKARAQFDALENSALRLGASTKFSPKEAAGGLQELAALGFNVKESLEAIEPTMRFAGVTQLSVAESAGIAGSALKAFGLTTRDLPLVLDKMSIASNISAIQATDLSVAIAKVGKGAVIAGQDLTEMLAVMGMGKATGLDMEVVATSVNAALVAMATTGRKTLQEYKVEIEDGHGSFRKFGDIIIDISKKTEKMGDIDRTKFLYKSFGQYGLSVVTPILSQLQKGLPDASGKLLKGADALNYFRTALDSAEGALKKQQSNVESTYDYQKQLISNQIDTLMVLMGKPAEGLLTPMLTSISGGMRSMIEGIMDFEPRRDAPRLTAFWDGLVLMWRKDISPAVSELRTAFDALITPLGDIFGLFGAGETKLGAFHVAGQLIGTMINTFIVPQIKLATMLLQGLGLVVDYMTPKWQDTVADLVFVKDALFGLIAGTGNAKEHLGILMTGIADVMTLPVRGAIMLMLDLVSSGISAVAQLTSTIDADLGRKIQVQADKMAGLSDTVSRGFLDKRAELLASVNKDINVKIEGEVSQPVNVKVDGETIAKSRSKTALRAAASGRQPALSPEERGLIIQGTEIRAVQPGDVAAKS